MMPRHVPEATSTPTNVPHVSGRKGIRDSSSFQSPIDLEKTRHQYDTRLSSNIYRIHENADTPRTDRMSPGHSPEASPRLSPKKNARRSRSYDSEESEDHSDGEGITSDEDYQQPHTEHANEDQRQFPISKGVTVVILVLAVFLGGLYFSESSVKTQSRETDLNKIFSSLEKEFRQDEDFWINILSNIKEIPLLEQPRTIIFLYDNKGENTLNKILKKVSEVALCNLTGCSNNALIIEGPSLNTSEIVNDYGKIITKYQNNLEENGVMIVKNLEKVPGLSAQAFHSFCDDYNPLVKKALILFTMKVQSLPKGYPMKFVEDFLLKLWNDISRDDKFYPLFTRISGTILTVRAE